MLRVALLLALGCAEPTSAPTDWHDVPDVRPDAVDPADCLSFVPGGTMVIPETSTLIDAPPSVYTFGVRSTCEAAIGDVVLDHFLLPSLPPRFPARTTTWFTVERRSPERRTDIADMARLISPMNEVIDRMHFIGQIVGPELVAEVDASPILEVQIGCDAEATIPVRNVGELPAHIVSAEPSSSSSADVPLTGAFSRTPPFSLAPDETVELTYGFAPTRPMETAYGTMDVDYGVRTRIQISGGGVQLVTVPRQTVTAAIVTLVRGGTVSVPVELGPAANVLGVDVDGRAWPEDRWSLDADRAHVIVEEVPVGRREVTVELEAPCPE